MLSLDTLILFLNLRANLPEMATGLKDYMLREETASSMLKKAGEVVSDNLVIAMMLKGLPSELKSFVTVTTQRRKPHTLSSFKQALRTHEETMKACEKETDSDNVMFLKNQKIKCYGCGKIGHKKSECRNPITYLRSSSGKQGQKRWCSVCRTKTHYTYQCREKTNKDSAKSCEDISHTFAFTISSSPECVDTVNSFLVDTGATAHILNDKSLFSSFESSFEPEKHSIVFADGSRVNGLTHGVGKAKMQLRDSTGHVRDTVLENALYVPSFQQAIFSVQSATKHGSSVEFKEDVGLLKCKGGTIFEIVKKDQLYFLNSVNVSKCVSRPLQQ